MALIGTSVEDLEPGVTPHPALLEVQAGLPGAQAAGPQLEDDEFAGYEDYYDFDEQQNVFLPDGKQYVRIKKMNEGDRIKYLRATRSDVTINQRTQEAKIPFDQGSERTALLVHSIVNWHIVKRNPRTGKFELMPFGKGTQHSPLETWIASTNPDILGAIEKEIRKSNPWLLNEMSVEAIEKEIADLQELLAKAKEREAEGKDSSDK